MNRLATPAVLILALLGAWAAPLAAEAPEAVTRTLNAPLERVWEVSESVLKSLGWDIDERDRAVGWILTKSRGVEFKDFGVYGEGTRHKLRVWLKAAGAGKTSVSVERELYKEERILWMRDRKPLPTKDRSVETAVLAAIEKAL
jgi:hypothetical protein